MLWALLLVNVVGWVVVFRRQTRAYELLALMESRVTKLVALPLPGAHPYREPAPAPEAAPPAPRMQCSSPKFKGSGHQCPGWCDPRCQGGNCPSHCDEFCPAGCRG